MELFLSLRRFYMKWKTNMIVLFLGISLACANAPQEEMAQQAGLKIHVEFSQQLSSEKVETLLQNIVFYRFHFSGSFGEKEEEVDRTHYQEYVFSTIPYDSRLTIQVEALSLNKTIPYC